MDLRETLDQRGNRNRVACSFCYQNFSNDFKLRCHYFDFHKLSKHAYSRFELMEEEMEFRRELLQTLNISAFKKNDVILEEVKMLLNNNKGNFELLGYLISKLRRFL